MELEFVTLDRSRLVTGDNIESCILDVCNRFWLCTICIDLHPVTHSILLEILDDVPVLHVGLVCPLPYPKDFLSWICNHLHPGSWVIGESKVNSLNLHQMIHLLLDRERVTEFKVINQTIQCSYFALNIHLCPIGVILACILNLLDLLR